MKTLQEIEENLEEVGEELGFDSRAIGVVGRFDARTVVQENEVGMVCEDDENNAWHSFSFWIDPRNVE